MKRRALVTGITGMDGSHLAELLLSEGYEVYGLVRRTSTSNFWRIQHLINEKKITLIDGDLHDISSIMKSIEASDPELLFHLGANSFVGSSWAQPLAMCQTTGMGTLNTIEAVRLINPKIRVYIAATSELFGSSVPPQSENTPFHPRSPYGVAKLFGFHICQNYRESYDMFIVNGVLFNHCSPRRGIEFVERKITDGVARIKYRLRGELRLGNLDARRDFSASVDVMEAAYLMLQNDTPTDYVCGSGESHSIRELCDLAFSHVGLDYRDYVVVDPKFFRQAEVNHLLADPARIKAELGWKPKRNFEDLVQEMVDADCERVARELGRSYELDYSKVPLFV